MKQTAVYVMLFWVLASCREAGHCPVRATSVYVLVDQTGGRMELPKAESVEAVYDLRNDNTRGGIFTLQPISDVEYNPSASFSIDPQPAIMQNPALRRKEVEHFLGRVGASLRQAAIRPSGKPQSEIYAPLYHAIIALAGHRADRRTLIVVSDLAQNTDAFSVYRRQDLDLLINDPDKVGRILSRTGELPDMSNVSVQFSYTARDAGDSRRYSLMASLFKRMIEAKGGKVKVDGGMLTE